MLQKTHYFLQDSGFPLSPHLASTRKSIKLTVTHMVDDLLGL